MASRTLLLIAKRRAKDDPFVSELMKHYHVIKGHSGKHGLELVKTHHPHVIVLDAASMNTTGNRICKMLKDTLQNTPIVHIYPSPRTDAESMADILLFPPVDAARLQTTIDRLLSTPANEVINCGPFHMNIQTRLLIAHGEEIQLTPKMASLIETFLRNPGKTIDRKTLMEAVWDTDYLGDTRTLDVHIRFVRKVLENSTTKPRYLKTVRGVGYRLEVGVPEPS